MKDNQLESLQAEYKSTLNQFRIAGLVALLVLAFGAVFFHYTENLGWVDSFYFCTITLTTIGYGDITPTTSFGKIFTSFYAILGIGIIGTFANLLLKRSVTKKQLSNLSKNKTLKLDR